jgi:hypothetical protein
VVLAIGSVGLGQAPSLSITPPSAAQSGLLDSHRKQIDEYVDYWVKALMTAGEADKVLDARKNLIEGYNKYGGKAAEFQAAFAKSMAERGKAALSAKTPGSQELAGLKEVNLAVAAGRMAQLSLQPLLDAMVAHKDPGVRYFGWSAYVQLRPLALAEGGKAAKAMYNAVGRAAAEETDPYVLTALMDVFRMSPMPEPGVGITEGAYRTGQEKFYGLLKAHWTRLCQQLLDGEGAMAEAGANGLRAARVLATGLGADADKKTTMQMVINMTYGAGKAYDRAVMLLEAALFAKEVQAAADKARGMETTQPATAPAENPAMEKVKALAAKLGVDPATLAAMQGPAEHGASAVGLLLIECETSLNQLTGKGEPGDRHIQRPLSSTAAGDRGAAVQLGVLKWVDELKGYGVQHPRDVIEVKPATTPAKGP